MARISSFSVTYNTCLSSVTILGDRGYYGAGIYFTEFPAVAESYAHRGKILLSLLLLGKTFQVKPCACYQHLHHVFNTNMTYPP